MVNLKNFAFKHLLVMFFCNFVAPLKIGLQNNLIDVKPKWKRTYD